MMSELLLPLLGLRLNLHLSTPDQGNLSTLLTSNNKPDLDLLYITITMLFNSFSLPS